MQIQSINGINVRNNKFFQYKNKVQNSQTNNNIENKEDIKKTSQYYINFGRMMTHLPDVKDINIKMSAEEIDMIKNLTGDLSSKVTAIKNWFLEKNGYTRDLVQHEITHIPNAIEDKPVLGHFDKLSGKMQISENLMDKDNEYLAITVCHELIHFVDYARAYKKSGLEKIQQIISKHTDAIKEERADDIKNKKINIEYKPTSLKEKIKCFFSSDFKKKKIWQLKEAEKERLINIENAKIDEEYALNTDFWNRAIRQTNFSQNDNAEDYLKDFWDEDFIYTRDDMFNAEYNNMSYLFHPIDKHANEYLLEQAEQLNVGTEGLKYNLKRAEIFKKICDNLGIVDPNRITFSQMSKFDNLRSVAYSMVEKNLNLTKHELYLSLLYEINKLLEE